jgi:hypothetical protein
MFFAFAMGLLSRGDSGVAALPCLVSGFVGLAAQLSFGAQESHITELEKRIQQLEKRD